MDVIVGVNLPCAKPSKTFIVICYQLRISLIENLQTSNLINITKIE